MSRPHRLDELLVVRCHHHRSLISLQRPLQDQRGVEVEVICRLVQQQQSSRFTTPQRTRQRGLQALARTQPSQRNRHPRGIEPQLGESRAKLAGSDGAVKGAQAIEQ